MCNFFPLLLFIRRSANETKVAKQTVGEREKAMRRANENKRVNARANRFASVFICSKSYYFTLCFAINNKIARIHSHAAAVASRSALAHGYIMKARVSSRLPAQVKTEAYEMYIKSM